MSDKPRKGVGTPDLLETLALAHPKVGEFREENGLIYEIFQVFIGGPYDMHPVWAGELVDGQEPPSGGRFIVVKEHFVVTKRGE